MKNNNSGCAIFGLLMFLLCILVWRCSDIPKISETENLELTRQARLNRINKAFKAGDFQTVSRLMNTWKMSHPGIPLFEDSNTQHKENPNKVVIVNNEQTSEGNVPLNKSTPPVEISSSKISSENLPKMEDSLLDNKQELPKLVYVNDNEKIYHGEKCSDLSTASKSMTIKDASKLGYKPCSICRPLLVKGTEEYKGTFTEPYVKRPEPKVVMVPSLPPILPYDNSMGYNPNLQNQVIPQSTPGTWIHGYTRKDGTYVSGHYTNR